MGAVFGRVKLVLVVLVWSFFSAGANAQEAPPARIILGFSQGAQETPDPDRELRVRVAAIATATSLPMNWSRRLATGSVLVELPDSVLATRLIDTLEHDESLRRRVGLRFAEPDRLMQANALPNDTDAANLWGLAGPAEGSVAGVGAFSAWSTTTGNGVVVGVIDTGYRPHADLAANVIDQYDFISDSVNANDGGGRDSDARDPGDWRSASDCGGAGAANSSWHGTHVAGTIAAIAQNAYGVAGVAPDAKLVIARVLGKCGGYTSDISDAIVWASGGSVAGVPANGHPAAVLNLSLGGAYACSTSPETQNAINSARSRNTVVVVAAGNSNADASGYSPASCSGVVTVAAVGPTGARAYYSNYGAVVDVAAPGGNTSTGIANGIESTLNSGTTTPAADSFAFYQGTSMAAPHVAGVAALMKSLNPALTPDQAEQMLKASTRSFPAACTGCGSGLVDAGQALSAVIGGTATPLVADVPVDNLSGSVGGSSMFVLNVPAYATDLTVAIVAGAGQARLYVRRGAIPSASTYDCVADVVGGVASCVFPGAVAAGTYYVMLSAVTDFSGYSLYASHGSNPPGTLAFTQSTSTIGEAGGTATLLVTRSGGSNGAISVSYATANGTATAGSDYTAKSGTLSWAAGDTAAKSITVSVLNDSTAEPTETLQVVLSKPTNGATLGSPSSAALSIADNDSDPGVLAFSVASYTVSESATTVSLTVTRTGGKYGVVTANYATVADTAVAGSDFVAKSGTLTWGNGDAASKTVSVTLTNDLIAEPTESFSVQLSGPTGGASLGGLSAATVSITDNDGAAGTLSLAAAMYSVNEGVGSAVLTVNRTGGSGGAVSVAFSTGGGTAAAGTDYTAASGVVTWAASDPTPKTITVPITADTLWESNKTFVVTLSAPTGGATLGAQKTSTVTIVDDDNTPGVVALSVAAYTVQETSATITLTATRSGGNSGAINVAYTTVDGTATAGADYTAKTGTLSWANGDSANKTFTISITNDLFAESTEVFTVALSNPTAGATLGSLSSASVSIVDNDSAPGTLAFSATAYTVSEAGGSATLTVTRSGGSGGAVTVGYAITGGTATAGVDYTTVSGSLSWAAADPASKTIQIPIADDAIWEPGETVVVTLSAPTGGASLGANKSATVTISDNDNNPGVIQFSAANFSVQENVTTVTVTATRTGGNAGAVGASYATADASAVAGSDYTAKAGTLSWTNGDSANKTFTVGILNDLIAESSEAFTATLSGPTGGASLGALSSATVAINDDDTAPGTLVLAASSYSTAETAGSVVVTVKRTSGSGGAISVAYATTGGTATAGSDYTSVSGTLNWPAGDPGTRTISIPTLDDTLWESAETIVLALSAPTGGAVLGTPASTTISIAANDNNPGVLSFAVDNVNMSEASTSVTISVTRTGGSSGTVGVAYATSGGSATAGSDYVAKSGTLSWAGGDVAKKTFTVTLTNDTAKEGTETIGLLLSSPTGGATIGTGSATVTIADND